MMKSEGDFQREILKTKTQYHICQAESTKINPGIFDLNIAGNTREHWVELKWKYSDRKPKIRTSQIRWAEKRMLYNSSLWMITGSNNITMMHHAQEMRRLRARPWEEWEESAIWIVATDTFFRSINDLLADAFEERWNRKIIGVNELEFL